MKINTTNPKLIEAITAPVKVIGLYTTGGKILFKFRSSVLTGELKSIDNGDDFTNEE